MLCYFCTIKTTDTHHSRATFSVMLLRSLCFFRTCRVYHACFSSMVVCNTFCRCQRIEFIHVRLISNKPEYNHRCQSETHACCSDWYHFHFAWFSFCRCQKSSQLCLFIGKFQYFKRLTIVEKDRTKICICKMY